MTHRLEPTELTRDLDYWEVSLASGETVQVRAHAYSEQAGDVVFVALMRGTPNYECEVVRIPASAVTDVEGGWVKPRSADPPPKSH